MTDGQEAPRDAGPIAFVAAMPMELRPLTKRLGLAKATIAGRPGAHGEVDGHPAVGVVSGIGTSLADETVEDLVAAFAPSLVVMVGIAGAVEDETSIGTVIVPERIVDAATGRKHTPTTLPGPTPGGTLWTTDEITTADELPALREQGVVALDMETAAVADVCERHDVRWWSVRAISDRATDGSVDDAVFGLTRPDGTPDGWAAARYVLRNPGQIPNLVRLGRGSSLAARRAADAAINAVRADLAARPRHT